MDTVSSSSPLVLSSNNTKRARDAAEDEAEAAKRLRPEDLLDMLDDDTDAQGAAGDLASVMRSFEEEIAAGDVSDAVAPTQPELGFLLEASDDELGLPPATASSSEEEAGAGEPEDAIGFGGQIWGFEDEMGGGYAALPLFNLGCKVSSRRLKTEGRKLGKKFHGWRMEEKIRNELYSDGNLEIRSFQASLDCMKKVKQEILNV
uniref:Uncharacterized protein n=1 Tax=Oryza brachyantha TaxID=4533 RepID=J3KW38_ORYBR